MSKKHVTISMEETLWRSFKSNCAVLGKIPSKVLSSFVEDWLITLWFPVIKDKENHDATD